MNAFALCFGLVSIENKMGSVRLVRITGEAVAVNCVEVVNCSMGITLEVVETSVFVSSFECTGSACRSSI